MTEEQVIATFDHGEQPFGYVVQREVETSHEYVTSSYWRDIVGMRYETEAAARDAVESVKAYNRPTRLRIVKRTRA